jgi:hypothetical protein
MGFAIVDGPASSHSCEEPHDDRRDRGRSERMEESVSD